MKTATIHIDRDCESPREWSNIGTLCLFHRRRNLPNESGMSMEELSVITGEPDFNGVVLPVFAYEHSGITLSTSPFSCPFDSGQLGVIYADANQLLHEYGEHWPSVVDHIQDALRQEVETFNQWLNGECYGYVIKDEDGSDIDSCWGFLGYDTVVEAAKEAGAEKIVVEVQD
jgi:hypothetical protein